ncbi:predicted protein [Naegleria gruberi]|uniref:Predicted protein n=1 Tax=Naegleria gruberi TaxID=5762 RepID=D2VI77_NAEGR|nr:uncharacterized protein NAEGRDRAFT_49758 [Naegleria gruberi]EFC43462.1 predicted protein [Naegleria gruberi]|eukprot:XP_002676206.1 predicted protein [Naegleria gruberi strain NEG-M]
MTCSTFCSGGLDCSVFVWDAERLCSIRSYFESISNNIVSNQQVNNQEFGQKPFQQYDIQSLQNYYPPHLNPQPKHSVYALDISTCGNNGTLIEQHMLVAAGSTDQLVRLYDLRTSSKVGKLRGHKDNIRCLKLTTDGKNCITGSTDGTVKYWDLRNQRCLQTFSFNSSKTSTNASIWTLEFDPFDTDQASFTIGTRDGFVYYLDAKNKKMCTVADLNSMTSQSFNKHSVLCTSIAPKGGKLSSTIWVGSTDSNIYEFEYGKLVDGLSASKDPYSENNAVLTPKSASNSFNAMDMSPVFSNLVDYSPLTPKTPSRARASSFQVQRKPSGTLHCHPKSKILGCPGIIAHFILNCRKRVLVKDNSGRVTLWDITTGNMIKDYTELNNTMTDDGEDLFETLCNDFSKEMISVRNWFTVEKKLGCLEIVLNPNECFNAENYAFESGFKDAIEEEKVNYGVMTIQALFRNWKECRNEVLLQQMSEEERKEREERLSTEQREDLPQLLPERTFNLPENTSVIVHFEKNDSEKSPFKKQLRHFDGNETEITHIPQWVVDILRGIPPNVNPQSHKLSFYLEPAHDEKYLGPLLQNHAKLVAHRILRIYKVASHIATKLNLELPTVKELEESKKLYYELKAKEHEENPQIPLITQQDDENFDESLKLSAERDPNSQCRPEEFIEIICYGNRMKNTWNLAIANAFYRPNNVSWITLNYRQRYRTK